MASLKLETLAANLSDAEKNDLDALIADFNRASTERPAPAGVTDPQTRMDRIIERLDRLLQHAATIEDRLSQMAAIIRLSHEPRESLNQRLDTITAARRKGHER